MTAPTFDTPRHVLDQIKNLSGDCTMEATLRRPDGVVKTFRIPPGDVLPVHGRVRWDLWSIRWLR